MGTIWIPGAERLPCSVAGGTITSTAPARAVWHTVEGTSGAASSWTGSIKTLNGKSAEPHILYDPVTDRLGQFMALDLSARALKNDGATRTNRVGKVCIQIEVIAFSAEPFTAYWKPGPNWKKLVAALRSWGIPDVQPAGPFPVFIASPPHNVPENDRDRTTWLTKGGHFSHSQIPANDHGDPGAVSFSAMIAAAKAPVKPPVTPPKPPVVPPKPPEDTLSAQDVSDGMRTYLHDFYGPTGTGQTLRNDAKANAQAIVDATKAASDANVSALGDLTAAVQALTAAIKAKG